MRKTIIKWLDSQSIRNKVLVFGLLMSTVPLLLLSYYYYSFAKTDLENRILDKQKLMIENLSNEIELEFNETFQHIQILSSSNNIEKENSGFYELLQQVDSVEEVVMTNEKGMVEKRVSRYSLNLPDKNESWFSDKMWFDFRTNDKVYGEVEFNTFGQPIMKLAVPFRENGNRKGIGVTIQLQKIIGQISSLRQDNSAYLYLIDENGKVIAHQDYRKLWRDQPMIDQEDVLGVKTSLKEPRWTLVMEQPYSTVYQPINDMMRNGIMAVAIVTLIVSLISIYSGLYFTKPIVILDKAMKKLKFGYRIEPVQLTRNDEMGKLAQTFNEMSRDLQEKSVRLAQEKERLNVIVGGIGAGLALVTKEYKVTWMNPILHEWLSQAEISLPCYRLIGGMDAPCENCPITHPEFKVNIDHLMIGKTSNGEEKIFRHRVFPLNHAIEEEGEFLLVIEDITEQKMLEEKIVQTDKLSALGLMASGFAHEVNNPLATINVFAEDLLDRIETNDEELNEEEIKFYLTKMKENTERCKGITRNMLNFSRKSNWSLNHIDINETIQNSISLVEYSFKKYQIQLEVKVEEDLPEIFGDSLKLMQVLVNLLNNAVDAMEEGGTIMVLAKKVENSILLRIKDTGIGIPKDVLSKVFDPFYTTKPVGKGTGLGLSVCYGIIQQFGGTIAIQSEYKVGTTVDILLPSEVRTREGEQWLKQSS